MGVPESIRKVKRPINTIVVDLGNGKYGVRERKSVVYVKGGNPKPINGKIIGHIVDGKYIPLVDEVLSSPSMVSFGGAALVRSVSFDLYQELLNVFPIPFADFIITVASLRVIKPDIASNRYSTHYLRTFLSLYYPNVPLSKNSITKYCSELGMSFELREKYFINRINKLPNNHIIAVDGMLRQDTSEVNDLSNYSFKSRIKGIKDISILYAFDVTSMEPLCSMVFPGNSIDATSFNEFIEKNQLNNVLLVGDKGFHPKSVEKAKKTYKELHYLIPLRRNNLTAINNEMYAFDTIVEGYEQDIIGKKIKIDNNHYLYSFKDLKRENKEAHDFIERAKKKKDFTKEKYEEANYKFGTIVLESDLDLSLEEVYKCYNERWLIELVFKSYKSNMEITTTNYQNDFTVIGSEFINFISTVITTRILNKFKSLKLLDTMSYKEIMDDLNEVWLKTNVDINETPLIEKNYWYHLLKEPAILLVKLGLAKSSSIIINDQPKKRGRPKKK